MSPTTTSWISWDHAPLTHTTLILRNTQHILLRPSVFCYIEEKNKTILYQPHCNFLLSGESIYILTHERNLNIWCGAIHGCCDLCWAEEIALKSYVDRKQSCRVRSPRDFYFAQISFNKNRLQQKSCGKRFTGWKENWILLRKDGGKGGKFD